MKPWKAKRTPTAVFLGALMFHVTGLSAQSLETGPDALSETYRDWVVDCRSAQGNEAQSSGRLCEMSQNLRQQDNGQRVLTISLQTNASTEEALLTLVTPFGLDVTGTVRILIEDTQIAEFPFATCVPAGCVVQGQIGTEALSAMRAGESAQVALPTRGATTFEVSVSLLGFTSALNRLSDLLP